MALEAEEIILEGDEALIDAIRAWRKWLEHERKLSPHTLDGYGRDLDFFLRFLSQHLGESLTLAHLQNLDLTDFRAYLAKRVHEGLAKTSQARLLATLRNFFRFLERNELGKNANLKLLRSPRIPVDPPKALSIEETLELIDNGIKLDQDDWLNARDKAIFTLLYGAGLRLGEALGLQRKEAPLGELLRITGKGNKIRIVPILPQVSLAVDEYLRLCPHFAPPEGPLFLGKRGDGVNPGVMQRQMRRLRPILGLPETATPHSLRHSFASHILADGGELRAVQELLGHKALSTTQRYTAVSQKRLQEIHRNAHPKGK